MRWQPIEDAPRAESYDVAPTPMLLFGPETGITLGQAAIYPDGKCRGSAGSHLHGQIMEWGVTHWMPLPEPPNA